MWRPNTCHHVFALGIDEELAIEARFTGRRVAGKGDARGRGVAHIAKHHGLNIDRRAPAFRDVVHAPVELGPVIHPTGKDRAHRAPQLGRSVLWKGCAELGLHRSFVVNNDARPVIGRQRGIDADIEAVLVFVENFLEQMVVKAEHDV